MTLQVLNIPYAYIQQHELNKWLGEYREFWERYEGPHITLEHYIRLHHWKELKENESK